MKKTTPILLSLLSCISGLFAMEPAAGTVSSEQNFAISAGGGFADQTLADYEGSILVVMLVTPWCPICISHTAEVGDGVLDYFNAASRGALQGQNDQGIPIRSIALSTEPFSAVSNMPSIAANNGYDAWGLDADANRANPRRLLGYYRDGSITSNTLGNDRRRVVVLNLVDGSASHEYREILLNMNQFGSSNYASARAAINAVAPAPSELSFDQWRSGQTLPVDLNGLDDDPDRDGLANALEFYFGTDPTAADSIGSGVTLMEESGQRYMVYRRARGISGFTVEHQHSVNLSQWDALETSSIESSEFGEVDEYRLPLPAGGDQRFYRLELTIP